MRRARRQPPHDVVSILERALRTKKGADGLTVAEILQVTGKSLTWLRPRMQALKVQGKLEVGRAYREAIDGRMLLAPVYRIRP